METCSYSCVEMHPSGSDVSCRDFEHQYIF